MPADHRALIGLALAGGLIWLGPNAASPNLLGGEPPAAGRPSGQAVPQPLTDPEAEASLQQAQGLAKDWWVDDHASRAINLYEAAAARWRATDDRRREARALLALTSLYVNTNSFQQALETGGRVVELAKSSADHGTEADALTTLGLALEYAGNYERALMFTRQALHLYATLNDRRGEVRALNRVGLILYRLDKHRDAADHQQRALALARSLADRSNEPMQLIGLGRAHWGLGDPTAAYADFQQALQAAQAVGDAVRQAMALHSLGYIHAARGDYESAFTLYSQALVIRSQIPNRDAEAVTLGTLAATERSRGNLTEGLGYAERAVAIMESAGRRLAVDELRASQQAVRWNYYGRNIDILLRLHEREPLSGYASRAYAVSERARARSLLDLLAEERIDIRRDIPAELQAREETVEARLSDVQRRLVAARTNDAPADQIASLEGELARVDQDRALLEVEIRGRYREYASMAYPTPLDADQVGRLLDSKTALLEYVLDPTGSSLFVITDRGLTAFRLVDNIEIERLVADVRTALASPGRRELGGYIRASRQLYDTLVAPAGDALAGRNSLIIVPHGALHYLPFEALLTGDVADPRSTTDPGTLPYLVKRWTVSYAPSASVLASLRERDQSTGTSVDAARPALVAIADPVIARSDQRVESSAVPPTAGPERRDTRWTLPPLAHARDEVSSIAKRFKPDEVAWFVGDAAREADLKGDARLAKARYVHFATHGLIDETQPGRSALLLTSGSDARDDGLLQVHEIFKLRLAADLVVLSACDTALGKQVRGEGLMGLSRAFLYAGADSVIASLWRVADRSTPELMANLYSALAEGRDRATALRDAKLAMIGDERWSHPYYWASFALIGVP